MSSCSGGSGRAQPWRSGGTRRFPRPFAMREDAAPSAPPPLVALAIRASRGPGRGRGHPFPSLRCHAPAAAAGGGPNLQALGRGGSLQTALAGGSLAPVLAAGRAGSEAVAVPLSPRVHTGARHVPARLGLPARAALPECVCRAGAPGCDARHANG